MSSPVYRSHWPVVAQLIWTNPELFHRSSWVDYLARNSSIPSRNVYYLETMQARSYDIIFVLKIQINFVNIE